MYLYIHFYFVCVLLFISLFYLRPHPPLYIPTPTSPTIINSEAIAAILLVSRAYVFSHTYNDSIRISSTWLKYCGETTLLMACRTPMTSPSKSCNACD